MKTIRTLVLFVVALFIVTAVKGAPPAEKLFQPGEANLELSGNGTIGNAQRSKDDVNFGVGLGANYWFTRGFGGGIRLEGEDVHGLLVKNAVGRLSVRAPLWDTVAPYGYLDGSFNLERDRWEAGAGGGLELRLTHAWAIFGEAGLNVDTRGEGRMRGATGIRLVF